MNIKDIKISSIKIISKEDSGTTSVTTIASTEPLPRRHNIFDVVVNYMNCNGEIAPQSDSKRIHTTDSLDDMRLKQNIFCVWLMKWAQQRESGDLHKCAMEFLNLFMPLKGDIISLQSARLESAMIIRINKKYAIKIVDNIGDLKRPQWNLRENTANLQNNENLQEETPQAKTARLIGYLDDNLEREKFIDGLVNKGGIISKVALVPHLRNF
ncbi:hypothetical protein CCY99_08760 [Helicobacter sp. 16-1353]|uniref:hypothetical protein n=1 Tax=Helicobacter sp. 16-1353 TaxID=2004996 RepID=UPI000DCBE3BA|nr:hypothetical protein [Helicobacter sp. 16-1353]RAX51640.1 hypothetical protein CCY99_08760 [Helicobacter sp. 16-1353]